MPFCRLLTAADSVAAGLAARRAYSVRVTGDFCPPRTEARGLHLKEYRLSEVTRLLQQAGFNRVATPLIVSRRKIHLAGMGLSRWKQRLEPWLERLPVRPAHLACRGLGLSCTIATK